MVSSEDTVTVQLKVEDPNKKSSQTNWDVLVGLEQDYSPLSSQTLGFLYIVSCAHIYTCIVVESLSYLGLLSVTVYSKRDLS